MLGDLIGERLHKSLKVFLASYFADVLSGEVAVHTGSIPVAFDGLAMQFHIDFVFLAEAHHQIASGPGVIGGFSGTLGEDLEFPLTFGYFGVDALVIDAGGKTEF